MKRAVIIMLLFLSSVALCGQRNERVRGSICGLVLDEKGAPASHVRVTAIRRMGPGGGSIGLPFSDTDERGRYCLSSLDFGEYVLTAFDEEKGYPHRHSAFYRWQTPDPQAKLSQLNPHARVDWKIPFKAAFVKIQTPEPLNSEQDEAVSVSFQVRSRPEVGKLGMGPPVAAGRLLTFLLPPDEDVLLVVNCADGHKWPDDTGEPKPFHLRSGETEIVSVPDSCFVKKPSF